MTEKYRHVTISTEVVNTYSRMIHNHLANNYKAIHNDSQIARLTGVSQPTVSRVLNGNTAVNPEIRERVLACAREHDFQPNVMAQSLVGSKTRLIGVIVTDISNSFFAELVKYIGEEARKDGYSLILFSSDYDLEKERECLDVVRRYRVDGLIMVPVDENGAEWRGMVSRLDIPTVVITRHATGIDSFYVAHDEAGAQVARHLHEQGYEEYIFFGNTTDDKYLGFIDGMANECREFRKHLTIISSKDSQVIEAALKEHFAKTTGKTGIFAYNDRRAVQMMGILQKMKIRVPEQVRPCPVSHNQMRPWHRWQYRGCFTGWIIRMIRREKIIRFMRS